MNRKNKAAFDRIQAAAAAFRRAVTENLQDFRQKDAEAREDSERFKDSEQIYADNRAKLITITKNAIELSRKRFSEIVAAEISPLSEELRGHCLSTPNPALLTSLRTFKDFGLQPSKTEIESLITAAGGNSLGLRSINATLAATRSPYRVSFSDVTDFEKDLSELEKLSKCSWSPLDFHHEACAVLGDTKSQSNSTTIILERAAFESSLKKVSEMTARWTEEVLPSIEQAENYEDKNEYLSDRQSTGSNATVERTENEAIERAKQIGQAASRANDKARDTLSLYGKGLK